MKGLIHLYYGDGKGKTTAAMGLALRAAGCGKRVVIVQFLKDGNSSEIKFLNKLENITVVAGKVCVEFAWNMDAAQKNKTKKLHEENLKEALKIKADLLILDEICDVCNNGLINESIVRNFILNKPEDLEVVLTGRNPKDYMIENADYITKMEKIKHPFDRGITAREGIEY